MNIRKIDDFNWGGMRPNLCSILNRPKRDDENYVIDTGVSNTDRDGSIQLSIGAIRELGENIGMLSPETATRFSRAIEQAGIEHQTVTNEKELLERQVALLQSQLELAEGVKQDAISQFRQKDAEFKELSAEIIVLEDERDELSHRLEGLDK